MASNPIDRRHLLTGAALLGAAPAAVSAETFSGQGVPWRENRAAAPVAADRSAGWLFFSPAEAAFIQAACARLIPKDATGPGAVEAGVPVFLDRQLAGDYGQAGRWYMHGPWPKGQPTQGYQSRYTPAQMYRAAIVEIGQALGREGAADFARLSPADQDAFLKRLEAGTVTLATVDAKAFFALLLQNVMEGFFSDPLYGGNRDMAGWRMIGFPGARYDYRPYVLRHGEPMAFTPVSARGRTP